MEIIEKNEKKFKSICDYKLMKLINNGLFCVFFLFFESKKIEMFVRLILDINLCRF